MLKFWLTVKYQNIIRIFNRKLRQFSVWLSGMSCLNNLSFNVKGKNKIHLPNKNIEEGFLCPK